MELPKMVDRFESEGCQMFGMWGYMNVTSNQRAGHPVPAPVGKQMIPPRVNYVCRPNTPCCGKQHGMSCLNNPWSLGDKDKSLTIMLVDHQSTLVSDAIYFLGSDRCWRIDNCTMFIFPGAIMPHGLWADTHISDWSAVSFVHRG
jgi:hypothetical protein